MSLYPGRSNDINILGGFTRAFIFRYAFEEKDVIVFVKDLEDSPLKWYVKILCYSLACICTCLSIQFLQFHGAISHRSSCESCSRVHIHQQKRLALGQIFSGG